MYLCSIRRISNKQKIEKKKKVSLTLLHSKAAALCSSRWRKQWLHLLLLKIFGENLRQSEVRVVVDVVVVGGDVAAAVDDMLEERPTAKLQQPEEDKENNSRKN